MKHICSNCGKEFEKPKSAFKRNKTLNRCCSVACAAQKRTLPDVEVTCAWCGKKFMYSLANLNKRNKKSKNKRNLLCSQECRINFLNKITRRDKFCSFRRAYYHCKYKNKYYKKICNISLEDILEQYNKQNGLCALSGIKMLLPEHTKDFKKDPRQMSIDRIDSFKGYTKDNIQLVCISLNYAKNHFTNDQFINFLEELKTNLNGSQHSNLSHDFLNIEPLPEHELPYAQDFDCNRELQ